MINSIKEFEQEWAALSDHTRKILDALTPESLTQSVADDHRTIARMAWHITTSIPEMANRTGLKVEGPAEGSPLPETLQEIKEGYDTAARSLLEQITSNWDDASFQVEDDMYGQTWKRSFTLKVLMEHEIHHRAQMTVLMRQAGLMVPGVFGPSKEEWSNYGAGFPEI